MKKTAKPFLGLFLAVLVAFNAGCSAGSSSKGTVQNAGYSGGLTNYTADTQKADQKSSSGPASASADLTKALENRKIIKTADVSLQTLSYEKTVSEFETLVARYGGFIQNSLTQGTGIGESAENRKAVYTVRIPSAKLEDFLNGIGAIGKTVSKSVKGEDISQNYYDTEFRLKTLKTEESRILGMLSEATKMSDMLEIEQRLTEVQTQIEQFTGELQKWNSLIDLSTVNVTVSEVAELKKESGKDFGSRLASAFQDSVSALGRALQVLVLVIAAVIPFALVLCLAAAVVLLIRKWRGRNRKKPQP